MNIYVWGTGRLAGKVVGPWISIDKITGFIDNNREITTFMDKPVIHPKKLRDTEYDAVLVANLFSKEIYEQCIKMGGVDTRKLIYLYNNCALDDMNKDYEFVKSVVGKEYADVIRKRYHVVRGTEAYGDLCLNNTKYEEQTYMDTDYVRVKCFELAVKELKKKDIKGAVAEAGVFRGEFAQYINHAFSDRKLYLFDTFDGFDANEALNELKNGNCSDAFVSAYKNTNVKIVIDRMENLDNVVIRQGLFPQTAEGLEEIFAFVSLDMDFEESIYEGLKYFYPRMSDNGYIFIHDYNSSLKGVEKAVDRYEEESNILLKKMPLCDANGTLVVIK